MSQQKILGDYQTPQPLANLIVSKLFASGKQWKRVLEPTCGQGNFIQACVDLNLPVDEMIGLDIQPDYVDMARQIQSDNIAITIDQQDIFQIDLQTSLQWHHSGQLLIVGNPPWVTISTLGILNGDNLPIKSNSRKLSGLDALTGKSNFDIAESIWLKLLKEFATEQVTIALLCKTTVARKVAQHIYRQQLPISQMSLYRIDSKQWFDVAVDAGLFVVHINQLAPDYTVDVYDSFDTVLPSQSLGFIHQGIVADIHKYEEVAFIEGQSSFEWRQGIKHDASKIMELSRQEDEWVNGLGDSVDIEPDYIYPLVKSSDVKTIHPDFEPRKYVIVTQKSLQHNTAQIEYLAPKLWAYLTHHTEKLDARKSSIYDNAPRFAIFGIGDYSFMPYKVAVSGFYLPAQFALLTTYEQKVYMTDDTCYFLSFDTAWKALTVTALLSQPAVAQFIDSIVFSDAKRPLTKGLLSRINLKAVYEAMTFKDLLNATDKIKQQYNYDTEIPTGKKQFQSLFGRQLQLF